MLINLSELFTCEGKRKVYTVSFELGSIEFGGDIYKIVKAEPFELEIANIGGGKKYTMSGGTFRHCGSAVRQVPGTGNFCL